MKSRSLMTMMAMILLAGMLAVSGCGQKGALYLPDDQKKEKKSS
ncbi:MAG: lipoprotein [Gammaproteobacteria bacterium]|nr:lipoprotein [Gammaproteobacteria bacterium]MDH5594375.1 lipoprotein [Gammaproteobacteria bacterium]MDH5614469.1 lipoprotein [Gammaproteobacteria bacterium]